MSTPVPAVTRSAAVVVAGLAAACTFPTHTAQVVGPAARPPQVVARCPQQLMDHAAYVMRQIPRVNLGADKLSTQSLLGAPLRAESFLLTGGGMVEVLSYPTPEGICGRGNLMPLVFQNNRLIGYGANYYRDFVVPYLKTPLAMPQAHTYPQPAAPMAAVPTPPPLEEYNLGTIQPAAGYPVTIIEPTPRQPRLGRGMPLY